MCDFGKGGVSAIKNTFFVVVFFGESFCWSREASATVTRKDFSAFQDRRRCNNWVHKNLLLKISILSSVLPIFPRAWSVSLLISILKAFDGVLKVSSSQQLVA